MFPASPKLTKEIGRVVSLGSRVGFSEATLHDGDGRLCATATSTLLVFDGRFPTEPEAYLAEQQRLATLVGVLNRRLRERMREQLGATYGVSVVHRTYPLPDEHYQVLLHFDAAPERVRELHGELTAILDSVRATGATETELAQMATIQRRLLETQLQSNDYWMSRIGLALRRASSLSCQSAASGMAWRKRFSISS